MLSLPQPSRALLLGCFLDVQDQPLLVDPALGASAVGQFLLVTVGALRQALGRQEVMGATIRGTARRVAPFRIRHDAIPFVSPPTVQTNRPDRFLTKAEHPQSLGVMFGT